MRFRSDSSQVTYRATVQHPTSSYGLPVIVDDAGLAYGPAEIGDLHPVLEDGETQHDAIRASDELRRAGYTVDGFGRLAQNLDQLGRDRKMVADLFGKENARRHEY